MIGAEDPLALAERVQIDVPRPEAVADQTQVDREIVGAGERAWVIRAQHLAELTVRPLVQVERIAELAERPHVTAEAARRLQRVRVILAEDLRLRSEYLGVKLVGSLKASLRTQHVGDLRPQVQRLTVVLPDRLRPRLF